MVLGSYYLTVEEDNQKGEGMVFKDFDEMFMAYQNKLVELHAKVKVRIKLDESDRGKLVESTVGRFIFNEHIPQDLGFVNRDEDKYSLEIDKLVDKNTLGFIIDKCFRKHQNTKTAIVLDHIKETGFKYSTKGAITVSIGDMIVPDEKVELLAEAEEIVAKYEKSFRRGLISDEERYEKVIEVWSKTTDKVTDALMDGLDRMNNIFIMAHSGARGSKNQIRQLAGMRGLMANASGKTVEQPIRSNFREGLTVLEFFTSTHGSRKGLADTALRTADSGYLTRRLVDVSQDVIIRENDCGTEEYLNAKAFTDGKEVIEELWDRIEGRFSFEDINHPETGKKLVGKEELITELIADDIIAAGIQEVKIRTALGCKTRHGVCGTCYGRNLATGKDVNIGEAVGIIAAQSIGEPGTQLTMRTFHTGGVAGADITQGLPRIEELFEARKPKGLAIITEIPGRVSISESKRKREVTITDGDGEAISYNIPYGSRIKVKEGHFLEAGDEITNGSVNPHDILAIKGVAGVQSYIVKEVQRVYRMQGVDINDKHVEVIVRQMLNKVKVEDAGDTKLLPGGLVDLFEYRKENARVESEGGTLAVGETVLLGITKASLSTESFLSAASFQETTRVLTEAAIKGKEDHLIGLKENVLIGKLIPAGTGMRRYKDIAINTEDVVQEENEDITIDTINN